MALRTPEDRFRNIPDYAYEPRTVEAAGHRMAYVEHGTGDPILMLHGEPSWGFLYRKMILPLAAHGRVVAPDLVGFGRSDKPEHVKDHTFGLHLESVRRFVEKLDLHNITLVCQDWGGLLGLPVAVEQKDRFARLVIMNTGLPDGTHPMPEIWLRFREFVRSTEDLPIRFLIEAGCENPVPPEALDAYEAPFPGPEYKAGPRAMPELVPTRPDADGADIMRRTRDELSRWTKPALVLFGRRDAITRPAAPLLHELIPGAKAHPLEWIEGARHFLQEDAGEEVAARIAAFLGRAR